MGVVKTNKKNKKHDNVNLNGKKKDDKVKKKKKVSCLQCFKSPDDGGLEGKYRVAAPELMQDTFMSDSEDEGGEVECPIQQQQQYRYMNSEAGTLNRARPLEDSVTDGHLWPSNNDSRVATIERQPLDIGFLVSFVVDARGGAMKAKRRGGVRVIVPPAACAAPTRVTCRAATRRAPAAAPPPLMEGEALASRLLELQPQGAKFLAPVIIEVPIFTASCPEREIVILRSDTGETWQDHYLHNNDNPMIQEALTRERQEHGNSGESLGENGERVTRIITCDFPHYLAVVSRVRQEVHIIGPEGGTISSAHIPQVQALFPPQALTKRIRVGLQAHGANGALCRRVLPRHAAVSPVLTVEPRRRKFHRSITLTAPLPHPADQKINSHDKQSTANLRLLCSIMGGQARAVWEDVTGSTPLTITDDCASFTTTVSARFWLMNCQNVSDATKLATELYREMLLVPFEVRIVVLGKRLDALEGRLLVLYITDRYAYDTLLHQEHYTEVAHSTAVRFLDGKPIYLEFSGNLVPVTKSGTQPTFTFEGFKDNRVEFTVRVKHHEETPSGRIYFMNEPKVAKGEQQASPACVLDVSLPERIAPRAAKSHLDCLNLDQSGFDALKDELSFHWGDHNHSVGPPSIPHEHTTGPQINGHDKTIANGDVKYPTKETEEKDNKPQVNGDSQHDSNKTKATFDSDEDKTPMNTLEKGKKKPESGFLGGLADKVKNVFSHSEDKDDSKESSPKPQPKPRESKEKSPPKPAPRLINEDLLEKVEDMFKDVRTKPNLKDEDDINNQLYATKLIVDEDEFPNDVRNKTVEVYHQYEHMQPVDTPLCCKTSDPFIFYTGCCEDRYKKGERHRHDETSSLADRIEQVAFSSHEIGAVAENDIKNTLDKITKERDNIKQQADEVKEDVIVRSENLKNDLINKKDELRANIQDEVQKINDVASDKINELSNSADMVKVDTHVKIVDVQTKASPDISNAKSLTNDAVNNLVEAFDNTEKATKSKFNELDLAAMERAEEMRLRGHEKLYQLGKTFDETYEDVSNEAQDVKDKVNDFNNEINQTSSTIKDDLQSKTNNLKGAANNLKNDMNNAYNNVKQESKDTVDDIKQVTNEKLNELNESLGSPKDKKSKSKNKKDKKSKEGKNFFTGLVHNIFGEKDKIEDEFKGKIDEGKESANKLVKQASDAKNELEANISEEKEKLKQNASSVIQSAQNKKDDLLQSAKDTKQEIVTDARSAADELSQNVHDKTNEVINSTKETKDSVVQNIENKKEELLQNVQETKEEVLQNKNELIENMENKKDDLIANIEKKKDDLLESANNTKDQVIQRTQNAKDSLVQNVQNKTEDVVVELENRKNDIVFTTEEVFDNIQNKKNDLLQSVQDTTEDAVKSVKDKKDEVIQNVQNKTEETIIGLQNKKDELLQNVQDKSQEVVNNIENEKVKIVQTVQDKENEVAQSLQDKKSELEDSFNSTKYEIEKSIQHKTEETKNKLEDTKAGVKFAINEKTEELLDAKRAAQEESEERLNRIRQEAEQTTEEIKRAAEETLNAAADKKSEFESNFSNKFNDIKHIGADKLESIQQAASDKGNELQKSAKVTFDQVQDSASSALDTFESAAKDKANYAKETYDDLQSSARDTYADFRDDVQGLESSTQDTLHSFQSSAGNTFDSLDESARELLGGVQSSASNAEESSKELFGNVKDSFEGFQVAAGNKLEDIKGSAKDRLQEVDESWDKTKEDVREGGDAVTDTLANEADKFTSSLNDLGNSVFGTSGKGFMKDSSKKLLESEKSQSSPHKKSSGIPKLKRKK